MAPQVRLELTTLRLTAECSAIELLRNNGRADRIHAVCAIQIGIRRRPTLPGRFQPSTISAERLNFCVRYGNRWNPLAIVTGNWDLVGHFHVVAHSRVLLLSTFPCIRDHTYSLPENCTEFSLPPWPTKPCLPLPHVSFPSAS